jgi:hypothetical protein
MPINDRLGGMPLQRLLPDQALAKADEPLTPEKSYPRRLFAHTGQKWLEHFGMKASVTLLASILLSWWKTGVLGDVAVTLILTFLIVMASLYLLELLRAPYALDKAKREEILSLHDRVKLLEGEIAESKRVKVIFEISTKIWESTVLLTDPGDTEDWRDATSFFLEAKLFIRYRNDDATPLLINDLKLSIHNDVTGKEYSLTSDSLRPTYREPNGTVNRYFVGFMISGKKLTDYYFHQFQFDVSRECALSVDRNSNLRVTLNAAMQDPYSVDLDVPWNAARRGHATVSIRPISSVNS